MITIALATAALVSQPATHKLCGRSYTDRAQLLQQLKHNESVVQIPPHDHTYYWLDQDRLTVWWIHYDASGPDYVTCIRKWETRRGFVDGRVERDCGRNKSACAAHASQMIGIKF